MERYISNKIGDVLMQQGLVNENQLKDALVLQKLTLKKLGETFVDKGVISEQQLLEVLGSIHELPLVDFDNILIDVKVLALFDIETLRKHKILPLHIKGQDLIVATNDPLNVLALQEIRYVSGYQVKPVLASLKDITAHLEKVASSPISHALKSAHLADPYETPIIKQVNAILTQAVKEGASDIHFEPQADRLRVRFRIDGILFDKVTVPKDLSRKVVSRVKIMAGMDVAESRKPQDGRISWKEDDQSFDVRAATLLDKHGETVSLRILNKRAIALNFKTLGFDDGEIDLVNDLIKRPYGMFLVTGPTGAGKTTTLYSILSVLNKVSRNIITVEDPVEYQMEGITQSNINLYTEYSFANAIRHILRLDPDIIMVGEIRDVEAAEISVRAALTGHLLLSTLHTNTAAGAITRLLEMGIEPFLLSSTLVGVISQRLVRRLCPFCKKEVPVHADIERVMAHELSLPGPFMMAEPVGCEKCFHTGYAGRIGIYEILKVTPEIRGMITKGSADQEIAKAMAGSGMRTLRMSGYKKVLEQVTSYEEILRATLMENA